MFVWFCVLIFLCLCIFGLNLGLQAADCSLYFLGLIRWVGVGYEVYDDRYGTGACTCGYVFDLSALWDCFMFDQGLVGMVFLGGFCVEFDCPLVLFVGIGWI